jgi:GT2 family glycosyltransferase
VTRGGGKGLSGACNVRAVAVPLHNDYRDYVILDNGSPSVSEDVVRAEYVRTISRHEERSDPNAVTARVVNELLARVTLWDSVA